ncbi:570_t:CDS:2 [Ambispora leptoticha]|uniref:570_t:CDS:1 n=1 Tax=Ambispora leptoticha TaxID=144679 RepID=A0A9N8YPV2_9GLOM|nr:570_t:CDS:2 [Ambispora leptoticha]
MARADSGYISKHGSIYSDSSSQTLVERQEDVYSLIDNNNNNNSNHRTRFSSYSDLSVPDDYNSFAATPAPPLHPPSSLLQTFDLHQKQGQYSTSRRGSHTQNDPPQSIPQPYSTTYPFSHSRSSSLPSSNRSSISSSPSRAEQQLRGGEKWNLHRSRLSESDAPSHRSSLSGSVGDAATDFNAYDVIHELFDAYHDDDSIRSPIEQNLSNNFDDSRRELEIIQRKLEQESKNQQIDENPAKYPSPRSQNRQHQLDGSQPINFAQYQGVSNDPFNSSSKEKSPEEIESEAVAARNRKREAAVKEIITTERTYVDSLRKLVSYFLVPLKENYQKSTSKNVILSTKPMATMEDISALFGNVEQILSLHEQLLKQLEERYANWSPTELISGVFLQIAPYLKMYTTYLKSFPQAIATMDRLNKESQSFKKFLIQSSEKPALNGLQLNSFLIMPIQRIPRYKLLLEALLKYTHESHPDYTSLTKCVQQITVIADDVNEKIRDAENQQKVIEIQGQVEGLPSAIVRPARRFIFRGDLYKVLPRPPQFIKSRFAYTSTEDSRTHFLFNDLLIFCLDLKVKYIYKGQIDLAFATLKDIQDGQADKPFCFQISTQTQDGVKVNHTVRAKSEQEKSEWMTRISDAISALQNGIRRSYNNVGEQHLKPIRQSNFSVSASKRQTQPPSRAPIDPLFYSPKVPSGKSTKSKKEKDKNNRNSAPAVSSNKKNRETLSFDKLQNVGLDLPFV